MSSTTRVFAMLDLFTPSRPVWHADELAMALGYTRATGYRYVKELVEVGFLQKVSAGRLALGPRIIELDHQLRASDPVLLAAVPAMEALAVRTGFDVVLSAIFGGDRVIDTHRTRCHAGLALAYGRGRPRPLFHGAAPKVLVAHLPRHRLRQLYEAHQQDILTAGLGADWTAFRTAMSRIRKAGRYRSLGESDPGVGAIALPVCNADGDVVAAMALVGSTNAIDKLDDAQAVAWMTPALERVAANLRG